jgi:long-subunit fatty acid transport protein
MRGFVMAYRIVVETCVEDRIKEVLERFADQRFNDVTITAVGRQYKVDDRWALLYLLGFQSGLIRMRWRGYI